jgi:lysophospholipase L1-like esterase
MKHPSSSISILPFTILMAALAVAGSGCRTVDNDPARTAAAAKWGEELAAFAREDAASPPPPGAMLFVGSSSFRLWTNLAAAFPERRVINRGFGGSQMHELLVLIDRLVWPYDAPEIFVYEGDNDVANGKAPAQLADEFRQFARVVHRRQPDTTIYYVAIKPSPRRVQLLGQMTEANRLIREYCESKSWLRFIDVATPMLEASGKPRPELFGPDELHLNGAGYELWKNLLRAELGI